MTLIEELEAKAAGIRAAADREAAALEAQIASLKARAAAGEQHVAHFLSFTMDEARGLFHELSEHLGWWGAKQADAASYKPFPGGFLAAPGVTLPAGAGAVLDPVADAGAIAAGTVSALPECDPPAVPT